ncbi:MAG TPA: hypothetical protein VGZ91_12670 [Candidatus Sulfotelmatobacter sp.]|jgi:hypothetical protein|nr:hypothetical protein [Candidatus Sulfotelmatobacter sp.]
MTTRRSTTPSSGRSHRTTATTPSSGQTRRKKIVSAATMLPLALGLAGNAGTPAKVPTPAPTAQVESVSEGGFSQKCSSPLFPTDTATDMDKTSCSVDGKGGAETWQNEAKNNFCPSGDPNSPILTSIPELVALQTKAQETPNINFGNPRSHPLTSKAGPVQDRAPLVALGEGSLVQLVGYVKIARQEGAESVNCGANVPNAPAYHDIHISIVLSPADQECSGVVVEMTPHHRPEAWTPQLVNEVAAAGLLVRVTGQRMFDSSHTPCQNGSPISGDPSRISLWEVHPIYKFEVCSQGNCSSGGWVPLEAWTKP